MLRRSGVYVINEPDPENGTTENGGPDHVILNKMEEEGPEPKPEELTLGNTDTLPVETSTPIKPKRQKEKLPSVYK